MGGLRGTVKRVTKVEVLIEGYARKVKNGWLASSTVTLVESDTGEKLMADPGCNRKRLLKELSKRGLKTGDIDFILLTHSHTDHTLLTGMFENAAVLNNYDIYTEDEQLEHHGKVPGMPDLEIIPTPGHTATHCSLLVRTDKGVYALAGDVFWWIDGEEQKPADINKPDPTLSGDMKALVESRKRLLKLADFVVPGHGKIFKGKS